MQLALAQARLAALAGEVPVGAVVVKGGRVVGSGRNAPIEGHDPTAHAEIMALRSAAKALGNYRLEGCELFVTLEPCAMCSGTVLHARLDRVVFGAADPKTGAAGSVLNLFANQQLNHQTRVQAGVLAGPCAELLQDFFANRRDQKASQRQALFPLRDDALRTPEARFVHLPGYPWLAHYLSDLPALDGLRLHYLDEGPQNATQTYLCLHDAATWSHVFAPWIAERLQAGCRVVVPDLIGFGKSDKPKKEARHTLAWHARVLQEFAQRLELPTAVLLVQGTGASLGRLLMADVPGRWSECQVFDPSGDESAEVLLAPFPDPGHCAGPRAFGAMGPR